MAVGEYSQLQRVRTRRSSHTAFVEIALEFDSGLSMAEVDRRIASLRRQCAKSGRGRVSVLASASVNGPRTKGPLDQCLLG